MTASWPPSQRIDDYWQQLVTVALLGTDRREPPDAIGPIADVVADAVLPSVAERMLAEVAAAVAVRRGAFLPLPPVASLAGPVADERPVCTPAAAERWRHLVSSWTVLEDEWVLTLIERGWRAEPVLVPAMLARVRRDAVRWAHATVAAGPLC